MSARQFITVYDHPAFVPNPIPPAPKLQLKDGKPAPTLGDLLFLPLNELGRVPIEYKNLACATMLPDTHGLDIPSCMKTLHEWASHVRRETDRCIHQFQRAPDQYNNSEAYYRALMMITVLQQDFGVTYDADAAKTTEFKSSREGFLHGPLTGDKSGTCASCPSSTPPSTVASAIRSTLSLPRATCSPAGMTRGRASASTSRYPARA